MVPDRFRWMILLAGSYLFYASAHLSYVLLILFTTGSTWLAAGLLAKINAQIKEKAKTLTDKEERKRWKNCQARKKKGIVALVLIINFAILFLFKTSVYFLPQSLIFPLGISFYTFQTIGYVVDVYRGKFEPERNIFKYALFVSYFPQIIQGPIHRYEQLAPQLFEKKSFRWRNLKFGVWLFLWGLFKKLVISDRAAVFVNGVLGGDLQQTPGSMILMSVFFFNIQLYTDFSGGIDMVSGISTMLGIELGENFRRPFFSRTLGEYWRRWHISLGAWIKDYVFYPIAMSKLFAHFGTKVKERFGNHIGRTLPAGITSVITFVLIGIWHNVTWYYIVYGLWHGILMALSNMCAPLFQKFNDTFEVHTECMSFRWFQRFRTWMIVTIGEYFSLSTTLSMSILMFRRTLLDFRYPAVFLNMASYGLDAKDLMVLFLAVLILICVSMKQESGVKIREALECQNQWFQIVVTAGVIAVTAVFGIYGSGYDAANFIYGGF